MKNKKIISKVLILLMAVMLLPTNRVTSAEDISYSNDIKEEDIVTILPNYNELYGLEDNEEDHKPFSNARSSNQSADMKYIAVFIEFNDVTNITLNDSTTQQKAEEVFNTGGINSSSYGQIPLISLKEYLNKTSYGKVNIDTSMYPKNNGSIVSYVPDKPRTYFMKKSVYAADGYSNITEQRNREKELLDGALIAIKSQVEAEFTADELDSNGDGNIDAISFFAEGAYGSGGVNSQDLLWPHKANGYFQTKINGKSINTYNLVSVGDPKGLGGVFSSSRTGYSVVIHEFLHTLGLPDLYRVGEGVKPVPVGQWDIMAETISQSPQSITSFYLREQLNWGDRLETLGAGNHTVTLSVAEYVDPSEKVSVKVKSPFNEKEYFIIEYRKKDGLDKYIQMDNDGIIVYRINTEFNQWAGNITDDFLYIFRPNEESLGAGKGNLNQVTLSKESGRTLLGKSLGTEVAGFDNNTIHYSDGSNSGIIISNVSSSAANTITFNLSVPQSDGTGTKDDPFIINDPSDLQLVKNRNSAYFKMTNDIDMTGVSGFEGLGIFKGKFDGQGYKISNLNIEINNSASSASLFNTVDSNGEVKNLVLENITVKNEGGRAGALAGEIYGTVDNIKVVSGSIEGGSSGGAGGLTGYATDSAKITNCYSMANVTGGGKTGGLIGIGGNVTIEDSYVSGKVIKKNPSDVAGGIIGENMLIGSQISGQPYNKPKNTYFDIDKTTTEEGVGNVSIIGGSLVGGTGKEGPVGVSVDKEINLDSLTDPTKQIVLTTTPANTVLSGTWESSNTSIATVSSTGLVTLVSQGNAAINYNIPVGKNVMTLTTNIISTVQEVNIPDSNFKNALNKALGLTDLNGPITEAQLNNISGELDLSYSNIKNLDGIQYCTSITGLNLSGNTITKLNILNTLTALKTLNLESTNISDLSDIKDLVNLTYLRLEANNIDNISQLQGLTKLEELYLDRNNIEDISPLRNLVNLTSLTLDKNKIMDISPLKALVNLDNVKLDSQNLILPTKDGGKIVTAKNIIKGIDGQALYNMILNPVGIYDDNNITWQNVTEGTTNLTATFNENVTIGKGKATAVFSGTLNQPIVYNPGNAPVINGANDVTLKAGQVATFDSKAGVTITDDRDTLTIDDITITGVVNMPAAGTDETYKLIYEVTDSDGNSAKVERLVTVTNRLPIIIGLDKITVRKGYGYDLTAGVTAIDHEDGDLTAVIQFPSTATATNTKVSLFNKRSSIFIDRLDEGNYTVTYKVTDNDGNETINIREIEVVSNNAPIINGANDITIKAGQVATFDGKAGVTVIDDHDTLTIDDITITGVINIPTAGTDETYKLIYEVKDSDGNSVTVERLITVTNKVPTISGLSSIVIKEGSNADLVIGVTARDYEDGDLTSKIVMPTIDLKKLAVGTHEVSYSVTDSDGNTTVEKRTIVVIENDAPIINGATDITIKIGTAFDAMAGVTAIDNQDGDITASINVISAVDTNVIGVYEVVYTVTDSDGNITEVKRRVNVVSNDAPIINGANHITLKAGQVATFDSKAGVTVTDDHDTLTIDDITITGVINIPSAGTDETYKLIYEVKDSDGNSATIERLVTVTNRVPTISGLSSIVIKEGFTSDLVIGVTARDYEDGDITSKIVMPNIDLTTLAIGNHEVYYSVTDSDGNVTVEKRTIVVIENDAPIINGAIDITIKIGSAFDAMAGVTAIDNKDGDITASINVISAVDTNVIGVYEVIYTVTDSDGNITEVKRRVNVISNDAPIINGANHITLKAGQVATFDAKAGVTVTDDHDTLSIDDITITGVINIPAAGTDGTYKLIYTLTDSDGNIATVERLVTVTNRVPTISGLFNIVIKEGSNADLVTGVIARDYEDGEITSKIVVPTIDLKTLAVGTHEVSYSVTDSDGNTTVEKRTIVVEERKDDEIPPSEDSDANIPPVIKDGILSGILELISGKGTIQSPLEVELNDVSKEIANRFLLSLEGYKVKIKSVANKDNYTIVNMSIRNILSSGSDSDSNDEINIVISVKNIYTEALESLKEFVSRNEIKDEDTSEDEKEDEDKDLEDEDTDKKDDTEITKPNKPNNSNSNKPNSSNSNKLPNTGGRSVAVGLVSGLILSILGFVVIKKRKN